MKDLDFSFNTDAVVNGFKKMGQVANSAFKGILAKVGMVFVAFKGLKGVMNQMPEIGQALGIAKDIFLKNLLWPLRQSVMPLLQKLLNWVRDNRGMFVKWGMVIRNVFTIVTNVFKGFWEVLKGVGNFLFGIFNRILGVNTKNLEEMINLMTFKLAVGFILLKQVLGPIGEQLKPLVKFIADIAGTAFTAVMNFFSELFTKGSTLNSIFTGLVNLISEAINFVKEIGSSFLGGFLENIKKIEAPLESIVKSVQKIFTAIFGSDEKIKGWKVVFEEIGKILADTIVFVFEDIAKTLEAVIDAVTKFFAFWDTQKNIVQREKDVAGTVALQEKNKEDAKKKEDVRLGNVLMNIGKPDAPSNQKNLTVTVGNININTGSTADGKTIGKNIVDTIRVEYNKELTIQGGF